MSSNYTQLHIIALCITLWSNTLSAHVQQCSSDYNSDYNAQSTEHTCTTKKNNTQTAFTTENCCHYIAAGVIIGAIGLGIIGYILGFFDASDASIEQSCKNDLRAINAKYAHWSPPETPHVPFEISKRKYPYVHYAESIAHDIHTLQDNLYTLSIRLERINRQLMQSSSVTMTSAKHAMLNLHLDELTTVKKETATLLERLHALYRAVTMLREYHEERLLKTKLAELERHHRESLMWRDRNQYDYYKGKRVC